MFSKCAKFPFEVYKPESPGKETTLENPDKDTHSHPTLVISDLGLDIL